MGSSKVILVGATSLIVGIYALSIKKVETDYVATAQKHVASVQADRLIEATLRFALNDFANGSTSKSVVGMKALGGSVDYTAQKHRRTYKITATVNVGGVQKTVVATVDMATGQLKKSLKSIHRGQWIVTKYYVQG